MIWYSVILSLLVVTVGATASLEYAHTAEQSTKGALLHDTIHEEVLRLGESELEGMYTEDNKIPVYVYLDSEESFAKLPDYVTPILTSENFFSALLTMDEIYMLGELDIVSKITLPELATVHQTDKEKRCP